MKLTGLRERLRPANWPWTVGGFAICVLLVLACTWLLTKPGLETPIAVFQLVYIASALLFILTANDWVRFAITGFHLMLSGLVIYLVFFLIPPEEASALLPVRVALILGASVLTSFFLWHPVTGRWVMGR